MSNDKKPWLGGPVSEMSGHEVTMKMAHEELEAGNVASDSQLGQTFDHMITSHLEWSKWNLEANLALWHGATSYFPLLKLNKKDGVVPEDVGDWGDVSCKCGCGQEFLNMTLYNRLTYARVLAGIPFYVLSWNRCPTHNEAESGSETSSHLEGYAVDIACTNSEHRFIMLRALIEAGFTRIGIYSWGFHVDEDPNKPEGVCWIG